MNVIKQSSKLINISDRDVLKTIEKAAKICYQSEPDKDPTDFVKMLLRRKHLTPFEQVTARVKIITDRGVSHELVRHRLASFNQESTRYVNYGKKKFQFILPVEFYEVDKDDDIYTLWKDSISQSKHTYKQMISKNCAPQLARAVLPNSLKTEIIMVANLREWMHIFKLRCSDAAHPQIRELMIELREQFRKRIPVIFDDL